MIIILIASLIVFSFLLIKSADITVIAIKRLSDSFHAKSFAIAAIILSLGTSFPEIFVGATSAIEGTPQLALGVVLGSNIANLSLIVGLGALSAGTVYVRGEFLRRDLWISLVSGLAPIITLADGIISRADGIILLGIYLAYTTSFFKKKYIEIGKSQEMDEQLHRFLRRLNTVSKSRRHLVRLVVGLTLLLISADILVRTASALADQLSIPVFIVGLVIVAIGTSLPELAFSFRSLRTHASGMFFGNLLGSVIANSTLIIGIASLIRPIRVFTIDKYLIAAVTLVLISLLLWFFIRTKRRLDWWEAVLLIAVYLIFVVIEVIHF